MSHGVRWGFLQSKGQMHVGNERADVCTNYNITSLFFAKLGQSLENKLFFDHNGIPAHRAKVVQKCIGKH